MCNLRQDNLSFSCSPEHQFSICLTNHNSSLGSHCAFSSNLFQGQITQISIDQMNSPENKNVALEKFLDQTTLKPSNFWAGETLAARTLGFLNIILAQKWHSVIFQLSTEKSFPALQKVLNIFIHLWRF